MNAVGIVITPNVRGTIYEGPWVAESSNEEMISSFAHWDPQVHSLLKVCRFYNTGVSYFDLRSHARL